MKDQNISIYCERGVYFGGEIRDGKLSLVSEVYGDDFDSERHYEFSKEMTDKLFENISVEEFIQLCRRERVSGMEDYLNRHRIDCYCMTI